MCPDGPTLRKQKEGPESILDLGEMATAAAKPDQMVPHSVAKLRGIIDRRVLRYGRADQSVTSGRLIRGTSLNWPTVSSLM